MNIRPATPADAPAIAAIYADACLNGFGTFEEVPPSADEIVTRMANVQSRGLPYLVAEENGEILGYAYAGPFRLRAAYRYTVEDSVYVSPRAKGRGVGGAVLTAVLDACAAMGLRQVMAVIGDTGNEGSIGLHKALGFAPVGTFKDVGYKKERWLDIVLMQKSLNGGAQTPPDAPGLSLSGF
ncbi:GNAT family N-acetyltransferase [Caulobacter sp. NIBR2454]|uniref:GNAT family N-acetyltransferase n=1 Tax=Caulobacter sp. NIBR2454 TaxID=3015996 RepID=UPI0022B68DCC|nr:GNAT family N-acetyltransferase [Caulobacter sp. NIBR2454]